MGDDETLVRDARREDLPRVIALLAADQLGRHRELVTDPPLPEYIAAFEAIDADPKSRLLVLALGGEVVGTLQLNYLPGLSRHGAERAQIEAVRIAEGYRGRGLGRRMVEAAIALARARGCRVVQLTSDLRREDAQRFYRSLGFVHSHAGMKLPLDTD